MLTSLVHFKAIDGTIAMRQANLNYAEEINIGVVDGDEEGIAGNNQCVALFVIEHGIASIASMTVFRIYEGKRTWIAQSWTRPEYRRLGYHKRVFEKVCKIAKAKGSLVVVSNVSVNNIWMQAAARSRGSIIEMYRYEHKL